MYIIACKCSMQRERNTKRGINGTGKESLAGTCTKLENMGYGQTMQAKNVATARDHAVLVQDITISY